MHEWLSGSILIIITAVFFQSCVPTREIRDENVALSAHFQNTTEDTLNVATIKWREYFDDPFLISLIDTALVNNQELNIMLQNVEISKNEIKTRKGEYLPFVNIYAGAETEKVGEFTRNGAVEKNLPVREEETFPEPLPHYSVGLSSSWEVDIWKKLRNAKKAAVYEFLATTEGKNFMVTNLVAEIADTYYELVSLDNQLSIIEQNLEIQQNALQMVRLQKEAARATELAVKRFEAELLKNQSHKFELQQKIIETENRINYLVGRFPQTIQRDSDNFIEKDVNTLHAGLPSQLLENRPDIRQAELELQAAKLNTRIAKAAFYPRLELNAGIGLQAFKPKYLTSTPESVAFSLIGETIAPLINRNAIKAAYKSATDRQLQAIYEYEKSILTGFMEVSNLLSGIDNLKKSYESKNAQVEALMTSIDLSTRLFQSARIEYIEVLLTQRDALESRIELIETKKDQMLAKINIYKALGGGWR